MKIIHLCPVGIISTVNARVVIISVLNLNKRSGKPLLHGRAINNAKAIHLHEMLQHRSWPLSWLSISRIIEPLSRLYEKIMTKNMQRAWSYFFLSNEGSFLPPISFHSKATDGQFPGFSIVHSANDICFYLADSLNFYGSILPSCLKLFLTLYEIQFPSSFHYHKSPFIPILSPFIMLLLGL